MAKKVLAKVVQLYAGVDLLGSKQSLHAGMAELEVTPVGIKATSKKPGVDKKTGAITPPRIVLIPFANVKGVELYPESNE